MRAGLPGGPVRGVVCLWVALAPRRMACRSALGLTGLPGLPRTLVAEAAAGRGRPEGGGSASSNLHSGWLPSPGLCTSGGGSSNQGMEQHRADGPGRAGCGLVSARRSSSLSVGPTA